MIEVIIILFMRVFEGRFISMLYLFLSLNNIYDFYFIMQVLTSALTVLEIQFEGAERENKRIRNAGEQVLIIIFY